MSYKVITEMVVDFKKVKEYFDHLDEKCLSGRLSFSLQTIGQVHVGSGYPEIGTSAKLKKNILFYSNVSINKKVTIPGSSIKGSLRTYMECLSPKVSTDNNGEISVGHKDTECFFPLIDDIFGSAFRQRSRMSNISVDDFVPNSEEFKLCTVLVYPSFEPKSKDGIKVYFEDPADLPRQVEGEKFYIRAIPAQSIFTGSLYFKDFYSFELGLLFKALRLKGFRIGGKKEQGFGKVMFSDFSLTAFDKTTLSSTKLNNTEFDDFWKTKEYAYVSFLDSVGLKNDFDIISQVLNEGQE